MSNNNQESSDKENMFIKNYSSKIPHIYIPVPEFKFYHGASSEEKVDRKFIGRDGITQRLKSWLTDGATDTGVYLVTGFRGMGKSSFVGKVLNEITEKSLNLLPNYLKTMIILLCFLIAFHTFFVLLAIFILILFFLIFIIVQDKKIPDNIQDKKTFCYKSKEATRRIIEIIKPDEKDKRKRIIIKLNLGHEILNERDILSLISDSIEYEYEKYINCRGINWIYFITKCILIGGLSHIFSYYFIMPISSYLSHHTCLFNIPSLDIIKINNQIPNSYYILYTFFVTLILFFSFWFIWKLAGKLISKNNPNNPAAIYDRLHDLNQRIISSTIEEVNNSGGVGEKTSLFNISIGLRRNRNYPIADVREIEQRLSWILNEIADSGANAPKFIIVFDELDKIDPSSNHELVNMPKITPEFENTGSGFTGGASSRMRKQNLLKMLANMKYFISTAKVKFIFIAGRELYDAYLADASDRSYAVGSIFNNVIDVNSFLSREHNEKDVVSMTEEFICKQLLPKKESIIDILKEHGHDCGKDDKDYYTLKTYNKILEISDLYVRESDEDIERLREQTIIMLYQFATYLSFVSNGAPKKISNYFEKYIETESQVDEKKKKRLINILPNIICTTPKYYLSFSYRSQQKIGFIHYLTFPVINAILNNASRYGDKLLISACFLTNHIYKYHNSGFSWRNLENIPELLDINKSPDTRAFIDVIISFLERSHISTTINSLYHFKFPMRISEEISLMSRLSEEVSALFNFSLDDSLSLKEYYSTELKHYATLPNINNNNELHHVISGIHHILGDLYMLSEEYNEAIFEYQCCISLLMKDYEGKSDIEKNNNPHYLSHILNIARIMLKLCLVYEKRKTFDTAYVTYNELIALLTKFRYINSEELGLSYKQRIKKNISTWKDRDDILFLDDSYWWDKETKKKFNDNVQAEIEDNRRLHYEANMEELIPQLHRQLSPEKNTLANRLSLFEDVSLVYQALLGRLFILEKTGMNGITKESIDMVEFDFLCLQRAVYYEEKYMIAADFFRKLADILYYKNGLINSENNNFYMSLYFYDHNLEKDLYEYFIKNGYDNYEKLVKKLLTFNISKNFQSKEEGIITYKIEIDKINYSDVEKRIIKDFFISSDFVKRLQYRFGSENVEYNKYTSEFIFKNNIELKKISKCQIKRKILLDGYRNVNKVLVQDKRVPCYACKFYTRSLRIIKEKMLQSESEEKNHQISKAIFFIENLGSKRMFKSLKKNDIQTLAASLDGLGNTLFSCSREKDKISVQFINNFFTLINSDIHEKNIDDEIKWDFLKLSYIEKVLLYYWASAAYFKYAEKIKDAFERYKKLLHVFEAYLTIHQENEKNRKLINKIQDVIKLIFEKALQILYMQSENTNIGEQHKLNWIFSKPFEESIPFNLLSNYPDMEEMAIAICSIQQLCGNTESAAQMYKKLSSSSYRTNNTIAERIIALRFKADMNMAILYKLLNCKKLIYETEFSTFFINYLSFLQTTESLYVRANFFIVEGINNDTKTKIELIEFLIMDTMFSLSKIVETISPTIQTTLFTESYLGGVYMQLFECSQVFDFVYTMYRWCEDKNVNKLDSKIINRQRNWPQAISFVWENLYKIKKIFLNENLNENSERFFNEVMKNVNIPDFQNNMIDYPLDMALWKYKRAIEMHHEGNAYQELMSNMYFLEDNLSNNTFQFYFAIERYFNNCGLLNERIKKLKTVRKARPLFEMKKYTT